TETRNACFSGAEVRIDAMRRTAASEMVTDLSVMSASCRGQDPERIAILRGRPVCRPWRDPLRAVSHKSLKRLVFQARLAAGLAAVHTIGMKALRPRQWAA